MVRFPCIFHFSDSLNMIFRVAYLVCIMLQCFFLHATVNPTKTSRSLLRSGLLRRSQQNTLGSIPATVVSIATISEVPTISSTTSFSTVGSTSGRVDTHVSNRSHLIPSTFPPWSGSLSDLKPLIIHEDEHIIVVYKPPSILIQSDAITINTTTTNAISSSPDNNLFDAIHRYLTPPEPQPTKSSSKRGGVTSSSTNGPSPLLYLLHRLDRPCSGVVVFAKTKTVSYTTSSYTLLAQIVL